MIVQVLADITPKFRCDNAGGLRVKTTNSKVHCILCVEDAHLSLLCRDRAFVGFSLPKISDRFGGLPERIVERPIQARWAVHADCFGDTRLVLRDRFLGVSESCRTDNAKQEEAAFKCKAAQAVQAGGPVGVHRPCLKCIFPSLDFSQRTCPTPGWSLEPGLRSYPPDLHSSFAA